MTKKLKLVAYGDVNLAFEAYDKKDRHDVYGGTSCITRIEDPSIGWLNLSKKDLNRLLIEIGRLAHCAYELGYTDAIKDAQKVMMKINPPRIVLTKP